jgi:hypothetical protein
MALSEKFFLSENVKVYPCSFRGKGADGKQINPSARLITEEGFVRPVAVGSIDSYVIAGSNDLLKVVIGGYYFEITLDETQKFKTLSISTKLAGDQQVLASLYSDADNCLDVLDSKENKYYFVGLAFDTSGTTTLQVYDDNYTLRKESLLPEYSVVTGNFSINGNNTSKTHTAAFGTDTTTSMDDQFVVGHKNEDVQSLFIVGNGVNGKSNAFSTGSSDGTKINENTAITGTLAVSGKTTLDDTLDVTKATTLKNTLDVEKQLTAKEEANFVKNINIGKYEVEEDETKIEKYHSTIDALGDATFDETVKAKKAEIGENGAKITGSLNVAGKTSVKALKAASITNDGDLYVKGQTTLSDKLTISNGGITIKGDSSIAGKLTASSSKDSGYSNDAVIIKSDLLDLIYPIGSIYMIDPIQFGTTPSSNNCPIAKRLGGTWAVIEADFLRCETEAVTEKTLKAGSDKAWLMQHTHGVSNMKGSLTTTKLEDVFYIPRGEYSRWSAAIYNTTGTWSDNGTSIGKHISIKGGYNGDIDTPTGVPYKDETLQEMQLRKHEDHKPISVKIDMSHSHELNNMTASIDNNGTIKATDSTINRPHYRKVYAWIRTA